MAGKQKVIVDVEPGICMRCALDVMDLVVDIITLFGDNNDHIDELRERAITLKQVCMKNLIENHKGINASRKIKNNCNDSKS